VIGDFIRRVTFALLAAAVLSASAAVCVVALAFALYALVLPSVGPAGASAIVAGVAALLIALAALGLFLAARPRRRRIEPAAASGATARVIDFLREKPWVAISAAIGAGLLAVRNPGYLGAAVRSFLEGREAPKSRR